MFKITQTIISKNCYIKGYDKLFRVMDESHNPVQNITKQVMDILVYNKKVIRDGLIHVITPGAKPFETYVDVIIPKN